MATELINWIEIPVIDLARAKKFYESVFQFTLSDMKIGDELYCCFPNKNGTGFSGALIQYDFTAPGRTGPLVYLNPYGAIETAVNRIQSAGGKIIKGKEEIAPGMGFIAIFEDTEGNMLALQGQD